MSRELAVDDVVIEGASVLRVSSIRPEIGQLCLQGVRGEEFVMSLDDFNNRIALGQYRRRYGPFAIAVLPMPVRNLSETERSALNHRLELLEYVAECRRNGENWLNTVECLRARVGDRMEMPSLRTLQRWCKAFEQATSTDQVAPRFSQRGNKRRMTEQADRDFEEAVADEIMRSYFGSNKFNISQITKLVNAQCRDLAARRNYEFRGISRRSVMRRVHAMEHSLIACGRVSKADHDQEMRVAIRKLLVERPYERVEVDATPLDIFCCDENGVPIGRATCYAGIDAATGAVVMIKCSIQKPSQDFVLSALEFCFAPKDEAFNERYGLKYGWLPPAAILTIVLDNAAEHHGGLVLNALRYLNTTIDYPMAGTPQAKPFIERFFLTLKNGLINTLPGCTYSQSAFEGDPVARAQKECRLTLPALEALIIRWVADVYMQTPIQRLEHRFGIGCSPSRAMQILKQRHVVIPPPDPEEFRNACMRYHSREMTLGREGVSFHTMTFNSSQLGRLYQRCGQKTKVQVRYNPLDCRSVFVVDPQDSGVLIDAFNSLEGMPHIGFEEARAIRRAAYKSDAELSGMDYQIAHVKMLEEARTLSTGRRMADRNRAARTLDRQAIRQQAQRQESPRQDLPRDSDTPSIPLELQPLAAAPRRKKNRQGGVE